MKSLKLFFLVALVISLYAAHAEMNNKEDATVNETSNHLASSESEDSLSTSHFLSNFEASHRRLFQCNIYPKICRIKGSAGPDCCRKRCVNVETDRYNCGRCGKKCKYSQICCKGRCVNPMFNRRHCGDCNNECNKGSLCVYGMCGYA